MSHNLSKKTHPQKTNIAPYIIKLDLKLILEIVARGAMELRYFPSRVN